MNFVREESILSREIGVPIYKEATKNQYHFFYVDKPYERNFNESV